MGGSPLFLAVSGAPEQAIRGPHLRPRRLVGVRL
jgi:hypothetical protein